MMFTTERKSSLWALAVHESKEGEGFGTTLSRFADRVREATLAEVIGIIGERTVIDPKNTDTEAKAANSALHYVERRVRELVSVPLTTANAYRTDCSAEFPERSDARDHAKRSSSDE